MQVQPMRFRQPGWPLLQIICMQSSS